MRFCLECADIKHLHILVFQRNFDFAHMHHPRSFYEQVACRVVGIPDICQFWYTTALFRPVKYTKKCLNLPQNLSKLAKIDVLQAKKYTGLKNYTFAGSGSSDLYQQWLRARLSKGKMYRMSQNQQK